MKSAAAPVILGLDPGLERTGFAFLRKEGAALRRLEYGVIRTERGAPAGRRLSTLRTDALALIRRHGPERAAVERLFFSKNVTTAIPVAQARGVLLQVLDECGLAVDEYTPSQLKKAVAGHGRATKAQMMNWCALRLGFSGPLAQDDAADAVALALVQAGRREVGP